MWWVRRMRGENVCVCVMDAEETCVLCAPRGDVMAHSVLHRACSCLAPPPKQCMFTLVWTHLPPPYLAVLLGQFGTEGAEAPRHEEQSRGRGLQ